MNDRSVAVPSTKFGKTKSRTTNRLAFTVVATVGLMWPVLVLSATAAADPAAVSPGVPCLDMVQNFVAAPSAIPEPPQTAASALAAPEPAVPLAAPPLVGGLPPVPPVPVVPVPAAGAIPPVPPVVVPVAPLAEAVPGFPLLPSSLAVPHDFVCDGTAWSAKRNPATGVNPHSAQLAERRDQW